MKEKISLEASGMPGVIKTMEKHFGKLIKEASAVKTIPTSVIVGAPDKGREAYAVQGRFSIMVCRDYMDDEFKVLVQILDYVPEHQGGTWDERLSSSVEMGDAFTLDGKQIELTELERERAAEGALAMIESRKAE